MEIKITSKVSADSISKVNFMKDIEIDKDEILVFLQYSYYEIPKHTMFGDIELMEIYNQFGHVLSSIPNGHKTICKLKFWEGVSDEFKNLKEEDAWGFNENPIKLNAIKLNRDKKINDIL